MKDSTAILSQLNWSFWVRGWNLLLGLTEFATTHSYSQHSPPQLHLLVNLFLKHKDSMLGLKVKAIVSQSCLTLCDPMDCSLPVFFVHGMLQARILEWVGLKKWKWKSLRCVQLFWPHGLLPDILLCPWNSPGQNTGVGIHSLLQGIFPTKGSNPGFPDCKWIRYHMSHQGSLGRPMNTQRKTWKLFRRRKYSGQI